jgi:hypothetical protein
MGWDLVRGRILGGQLTINKHQVSSDGEASRCRCQHEDAKIDAANGRSSLQASRGTTELGLRDRCRDRATSVRGMTQPIFALLDCPAVNVSEECVREFAQLAHAELLCMSDVAFGALQRTKASWPARAWRPIVPRLTNKTLASLFLPRRRRRTKPPSCPRLKTDEGT